ncbi:lysylphosphatidylglycerol synthase transmembrane domain-containing protein [Salinibaculum rarum]|uniref:lysylphosphatidylglycerol synthase transmembrane domain-containing protein n=1 Tax=Salinibaculum rarum TaxID=3058903 RepID=UPI00265D6237|nr:lysylphosphatidylglycerol synthase transmembrane domain-containing protein [Salinibaculum sp. KK48]
MDQSARNIIVTLAKIGLAVAAFAWLLTQIDVGEAVALLGRLNATVLAAVLAVSVLGLLGRFYTWQATAAPIERVSLRGAGSVALVVNFINQLLPSRLTGRVAAPFVLRSRLGLSYPDATAVSGVHTALYSVYYGLAASVGLALAFDRLSPGLILVLALSTALYIAAGVFLLAAGTNLSRLDPLLDWFARLANRLPRIGASVAEQIRGLSAFAETSTDAFRKIALSPGVWLRYAAGWSLTLLVAAGVRVWLLLGSFGAELEPAVFIPLYLVAAYSVTLLPLTPGGIGVTEATATAVFVALGVPGEVIVPIVLIDRAMGIYLPALAGWYPSLHLDLSTLSTE